jgi:PAS domain S-box-containing protein
LKETLNTEIEKFDILQPIVAIFILFFLTVTFIYIFFVVNIDKEIKDMTTIFVSIFLILTVLLFLVIKFYINKLTRKISQIYRENLEYEKFSNNYLNALENTSPNLLISFVDNKIGKFNKAFLDLTGYENLDSFHKKHKCISELFINKEGYLKNDSSCENWLKYIMKRPDSLHKVIFKKNDVEHIFIVSARELKIDDKDRIIATFIDITEFENLQNRFKLAINATQDGLWDWDLTTGEVYFSARWKKQIGYEENELENLLKIWEEHVHPDDLKQAEFDIQQNVEGKTNLYENKHRLKHKDGSWVWIHDRGQTLFDENNKPVRMIGFHTNITDKVRIEKELHDNEEMMIAQSQNAAMGEMISMIAHQWRQPLSVISMSANNIMADLELDIIEYDSLKDTSTEIMEQTIELSKTIDDFRNFFKPKKTKEIVSIHEVFDDAFKIISKSLENNDVEIIKIFKSDKKIETYSRELMQVILNILKNSKEVLCEMKVENKIITINTYDYENSVVIEISDNAGGIPQGVIPKVFDPYFSTKNDKTGTGLGLYMCKVIIEKHLNGKINATNKEDGACFTIMIQDKKDKKIKR